MKSLRLIFGTYNHQPEGNLSELFERAYQSAYKPFLSLLYNHPRLPAVLYYCGSLYEWLEEHHPEFLMLLREMVRRKQVELLGGGFYSPILSLIPDGDKLGQIEMLTTYLRTTFGVRPRGGWLAERIWEPPLARILRNSGLEYTFLDDRHFHIAGIGPEHCFAPYLAEEQGKTIQVLPIRNALVEMVPIVSPAEVVEALRDLARDQDGRVAVLLVDGERLGEREGTHRICYEEKWLASFFELVEDNREWLAPLTPRLEEAVLQPRGRVYFPCLANGGLMRAALDTERQHVFQEASKRLRRPEAEVCMPGGYFRQFLTKYPECNLLYSRLLYTHLLVNQMRGDKSRKKSALQELWRGQHGAVYWHGDGPGGGIFDGRLRQASYRAFIEAEKLARSGQGFLPAIIPTDFDMDGEQEYLYQGRTLNAVLETRGAGLAELDFLPRSWNYLGTMARWPQPYHRFKYEGCDWYLRQAFLDHFFGAETQIEAFDRMSYAEQGDFLNQPFALVHLHREHEDITLARTGRLRLRRRDYPFTVQKRYRFKEAAVECSLLLRNDSAAALELWYGLELNLALASRGEAHLLALKGSQKKELGSERAEADKLEGVLVRDPANAVAIGLESASPFSLWSLPVETVSYPPSGRLRQYQSSCLVLSWKFALAAGEQWETKVSLRLESE
jgi:alpha-amylase